MRAGGAVDLPDRCPPLLGGKSVLADVAVRADRRIELRAIGTGDQVLGPVVVDRPGRQVDELGALAVEMRLARRIGKADHGVGVGDVELVADQRHAERRAEMVGEHRRRLRRAVWTQAAQQRDAVGARRAGTGTLHQLAHDHALDALAVFGLGRRIGLGDEHVAIRQHVEPARMVESGGVSGHPKAGGGDRLGAFAPALGRRDVDGRQQGLVRRRQLRRGTHAGGHRQGRRFTAGREQGGCGQWREKEEGGRSFHRKLYGWRTRHCHARPGRAS